MQTWITDTNWKTSAQNLDRSRLHANIYESIHVLSSLLSVNHMLVTPKRDVSNHPASKLWKGYEQQMLTYINAHIQEWVDRGYKCDVSIQNYNFLYSILIKREDWRKHNAGVPWITDEVVQTHRNVLYRKDSDFYPEEWKGNREMVYNWRKYNG